MDLWGFLTSATAPWWASLLGIVIGSAGSFFIAMWTDKRKVAQRDEELKYQRETARLSELKSTVAALDAAGENWWMGYSTERTVRQALPQARALPSGTNRDQALASIMDKLEAGAKQAQEGVKEVVSLSSLIFLIADDEIATKVRSILIKTTSLHSNKVNEAEIDQVANNLRKARLELTELTKAKIAVHG